MGRTTIEELRNRRVNAMTSAERAEFDEALATARLAIDVGEKVREAREAAGLSQRELAVRMSTSQAAVARLEAGGTSATLTTLQKARCRAGPRTHHRPRSRTLTMLSVSCPVVGLILERVVAVERLGGVADADVDHCGTAPPRR